MTSKLEEFAERAKKIAAESSDSVKEKLGEFQESADWDQIRDMAGTLGDDAAIFVRKYPLQSVLGAAVVGFLLGATLGKKN